MQQSDGLEQGSSETAGAGQRAHGLDQGVRILARTLFRYLLKQGYQARHIIILTSELISLVTRAARELKGARAESAGALTVETPPV